MYTEESGYIADKSLKKKVIEIIDNCIELDLYVVVDWHILSDGNPNKHVEDAELFFDEISKKYKDKPNVIYEICNEPNGNKSTWNDDIVPYANTIIPIIRENSPKSLIIVGTPEWSKDLKSVVENKLEYKNILYSCHFYAGTHGEELMAEIDNAIKNNIPVIISEWGTSTLTGGGGFFLGNSQKWMKFLDERNISWINWSFSNADESSAILKGNNINLNNINENLSESGMYIKSIINDERMENIINRMKELISSFDNEKKVYIHADMHPKNIMIDNNQNLYIIDIESFCIDYFVMNVRWSIAAAFRNKKNNEFFKGFIKGYYNNDIPIDFNKQLIFITILNFIEHTIEFSENKDKEFIVDYVSKINSIFNSIDLFSDNNILENTTMFEN